MGIKIIYNTIIDCIKQCIYTYVLKISRMIRDDQRGRLIILVVILIVINRLVAPRTIRWSDDKKKLCLQQDEL
jgi:hypothetical protein